MTLIELSNLDTAERAANSIADRVRSLSVSKISTFKDLRAMLDNDENRLVDWLLALKPADIGVNTPFCGFEEPMIDTAFHVSTETKIVHKADGSIKTYDDTNHVPLHIWQHWQEMLEALSKDGLTTLRIMSAYRSPAYQTAILYYRLSHNLNNPLEVFKQMSLPGYSQHGLIKNCAIDLIIEESFASSPEYKWLLDNAAKFGFYLSYPEGNQDGIIFEPWHWQWLGEK